MKTMPLIVLSALINTAAQLLLKAGMNQVGSFSFSWANVGPIALRVISSPFILGGLVTYVFAVVVWLLVLSRTEVSIAYPLVSVAYIFNAVAAYYIFGEDFSVMKVLGIGVIIFGVYLLARA